MFRFLQTSNNKTTPALWFNDIPLSSIIVQEVFIQKDPKSLHGHIPTELLVGEKQEYSQFDLLSLVQMLYHDHKPLLIRKHVNKAS